MIICYCDWFVQYVVCCLSCVVLVAGCLLCFRVMIDGCVYLPDDFIVVCLFYCVAVGGLFALFCWWLLCCVWFLNCLCRLVLFGGFACWVGLF